jgi:NitT/TauT family transport system substrate-binding protein
LFICPFDDARIDSNPMNRCLIRLLPSILVAVASVLLTACRKEPVQAESQPGTSTQLPELNFTHDWFPEPEHGGYYAAQLQGLWTNRGIKVNVLIGGPNSEIEKRVALDPNGLGIVRADAVVIAVERGLPIVAINSYFQHDPQGIMVRADSGIERFEQLEDRDIAMQVGNTWFLYLQKKYGWKKTRVRAVTGSVANFVKDPTWITQAYPTSEPYYALKEGVTPRVLQISNSGFDPYRVIIANKQLVEKHPDLVAKFSAGAYEGWKAYFANPLPVHEHILKISPSMEMEGMKFSYVKMRELHLVEGSRESGETMGDVRATRWTELGGILLDLGVVKSLPAAKELYTEAFTPTKLGIDPTLPTPIWQMSDVHWAK